MGEPAGDAHEQSFSEVVIGCVDIDATAEFLGIFGLTERTTEVLGATEVALYGSPEGAATTTVLNSPACMGRASVRLVAADQPGDAPSGWAHGPRALDIYTTDIDSSVAAVRAGGFEVSPEAVIAGGPMRMRQVRVSGPEGLPVVLVESTHRRSSVCDLPGGPQHSEPHSVVWAVADQAAESSRWADAGWTAGAGITFSEPSVSDELGLPESPTPVSMNMLSDSDVNPIRLELMTFDDHSEAGGAAADPLVPTAGGIRALVADVDTIREAMDSWESAATFSEVVQGEHSRVAVGLTRGGVRFVLRER